MNARRKALGLLRPHDFELTPLWLVDLPKFDFATPAEPFESLETDAPYIALTAYTPRDGTTLQGYCFIYACSGHVIFGPTEEPIHVCDFGHCLPDQASTVATALGRDVHDVFPIQFRTSVKVYGRVQEFEIRVQSNNRSSGLVLP